MDDQEMVQPTGDDPFGDINIEEFSLEGINDNRKERYSIAPDLDPNRLDNLVESAKGFREYIRNHTPDDIDGVPTDVTMMSMAILDRFIVREFLDLVGMPRRVGGALGPLAMTAFIMGMCVMKSYPEWGEWYLKQFPGEMDKMKGESSVAAFPLSIPMDEEKI